MRVENRVSRLHPNRVRIKQRVAKAMLALEAEWDPDEDERERIGGWRACWVEGGQSNFFEAVYLF